MILTVIVPDERPGMQRMLAEQLKDIDSEIIYEGWKDGLRLAKGDFVCLLEHDSGISKGSIAKQLEPFLVNPSFRKLAMVSPMVEFEDTEAMLMDGHQPQGMQQPQLARLACVGGAVIRRRSLLQHIEGLNDDLTSSSNNISVAFWENGLRIFADPTAIYYSPQQITRGGVVHVSTKLMELWTRECIA